MTPRTYTVREVNELRRVVEHKWMHGTHGTWPGNVVKTPPIVSRNEQEIAVEERVRTHMLAGHTAEDLINSEGPRHD